MKTSYTTHLLFALVFLCVSCAAETDKTGAAPIVRDSAGVTIIENVGPRQMGDAAWRLADSAQLTIGRESTDPGAELYRVTSAIRRDNGRIVIANAGTSEIRFYDDAGNFVRSVGEQGGGPGEFQTLSAVLRYGSDSIAALDTRQRRLTFYDLQGNLGRVTTILPNERANMQFLQGTVGAFSDGSFFLVTSNPFSGGPQDGPVRNAESTFRVASDGTLLDSLGAFSGREIYVQATGGGLRTTPRIFGYSTVYAMTGDYLFAGSNDKYEISRYTRNGYIDMSIRTNHEMVPVGAHHRDLFMQNRTADMSMTNRLAFEERFEISQPPSTFPAYDDIMTDREGNLWVSTYLPPDKYDQRFLVFDRDGRWITEVDVPDDIAVLEIGSNYVLALWRNELDVESVRLFELIKPEAAGGV